MKARNKGVIELGVLFSLFGLVILAFVTIGLLSYVYGLQDKSFFEATYFSKDMSSLISTISYVPGNVVFPYNSIKKGGNEIEAITENYAFSFDNGIVGIRTKNLEEDSTAQTFKKHKYWFNNKYYNKLTNMEYPDKLFFIKNGDEISTDVNINHLSNLRCDTFSRERKRILIDYGKGLGEYEEVPKRAVGYLSTLGYDTTLESKEGGEDVLPLINMADIIIRVEIGTSDYQMDIIKAYYPISEKTTENRAVACNILNTILTNEEFYHIQGVQLVPINLDEFNNGDEWGILQKNKINIIIQFGNANFDSDSNLLKISKNIRLFTSAIDEVLGGSS